MSDAHVPDVEDGGGGTASITFRSVVEPRPGEILRDLFQLWWPSYRRWHSLRNDPEVAVQVWAFARNPG